jgi:hypothetical protein
MDMAHLAVAIAVDDGDVDHSRFERERLCHGSLRDLYCHRKAPAGFFLVAGTGAAFSDEDMELGPIPGFRPLLVRCSG